MKYLLSFLIAALLIFNAVPSEAQKKKKASTKTATKRSAKKSSKAEATPAPEPAPAVETSAPAASGTATAAKTRPKRESLSHLFGSFAWLWWQEPLELVAPSGNRYAMVATANGPCFGAGWKYVRPSYELNFQGCFYSAGNEVGATVTDIGYYQQGVESYGVLIGPGYLYRPKSGSVGFGIQVPVFFRYSQWTLPPVAGYEIESSTLVTGGGLLQANWSSRKFTLAQKIGLFYKTGSMWALQIDFRF